MTRSDLNSVGTATTSREVAPLVLVVEDNEKNARLIMTMLNAAGYRTHWAIDGAQGLRLAEELNPDLVITDLQMPGMDGLEMTRGLKSLEARTHSIPVIAVSAHALADHRERALAAGCCQFVTKPFRYQSLIAEVADAIHNS